MSNDFDKTQMRPGGRERVERAKEAGGHYGGRVGAVLGNEAAGREAGRAIFGGIQMRTETRAKDRDNVREYFEKRKNK